jgi:tetratricopeptide (TPR) repeat protein
MNQPQPDRAFADEITRLEEKAADAIGEEKVRRAALLLEEARRLALSRGDEVRAFALGVHAAENWTYAGEDRRLLAILPGLLENTPDGVDPWAVYHAEAVFFWYLLERVPDPDLDDLTARAARLAELSAALGEPENRAIPDRLIGLRRKQGRWLDAIAECQVGCSRVDANGPLRVVFAIRAAMMALKLGRRGDAEQWLALVIFDGTSVSARIWEYWARLNFALCNGDCAAAGAALRYLDDAMIGVERPRYVAETTELAVAALALDQRLGDPMADSHPIARRLADFPRSELETSEGAYIWHKATLFRHLAGLRYAAGIEPADDYYHLERPPLPWSARARLPGEIPKRIATARDAVSTAMPAAGRLDTAFNCSWRQQEVLDLRRQIDAMAAVYDARSSNRPGKGIKMRARAKTAKAIEVMRREAAMSAGQFDYPMRLLDLSSALYERYLRFGELADLDDAVLLARDAHRALPADIRPVMAPVMLSMQSVILLNRFVRLNTTADLDAAVATAQEAASLTPADANWRAETLTGLSSALHSRYECTGSVADLRAAISAAEDAVAATAEQGGEVQITKLVVLADALLSRHARFGESGDMGAAVSAYRKALAVTPDRDPVRPAVLASLAIALRSRFVQTGTSTDLDEAIAAQQEALGLVSAKDPDLHAHLASLAVTLRYRHEITGSNPDLDRSLTLWRKVMASVPPEHRDRALYHFELGQAVTSQFGRTGEVADLNAAITVMRVAVDATGADNPDRAVWLSGLSAALGDRFRRLGPLSDLDDAIAGFREIVESTPDGFTERPVRLANLGAALYSRHVQTQAMADLDEAIAVLREATQTAAADRPGRNHWLCVLGLALSARFDRAGIPADQEESVASSREAVEITPAGSPSRPRMLSGFGHVMNARFVSLRDPAYLEEAVAACREAVDIASGDGPDRAEYLSDLSATLRLRAGHTAALADLDEAIASARSACDSTPADYPGRAMRLLTLGRALGARFERTGARGDLDELFDCCQAAVGVREAPPVARLAAAALWGRAAAATGKWSEAVAGYEAAIDLLGLTTPRALRRADQQDVLASLTGIASEAATCCVLAGLTDRAVELLEQGRGVLLGQALDTRTDLTILTEQHPELAERFTALRDALDSPVDPASLISGFGAVADRVPDNQRLAIGRLETERQRAAGLAFDQVIADIRAKPGFTNFLYPPSVAELSEAAIDGPIVIVNVSPFGAHALILTRNGVQEPLPLDSLQPARITSVVGDFLNATGGTYFPEEANAQLTVVLGWLWDVIAGPVLDRLRLSEPPPDGTNWPRLWWCLPGRLSMLPLQAAGHHDTRSALSPMTVLDRVVSSHTPTVRALIHARRARSARDTALPRSGAASQLLAVAPDYPEGIPELPGAKAEVQMLEQRFRGDVRTLTGPAATTGAVAAALPLTRWTHLACHGVTNLSDPSASSLLLHDADRPLTVADVARMRPPDAEMAFLSACSTAHPGSRLADEAIHLTSAFLLAGYRHVVGTLWPVSDRFAVQLADRFYAALAITGTADGAALALREATRGLRDSHPGASVIWASHIHAGA